ANRFLLLRSFGFALSVAWIVAVSDLARAVLVVRGGRSAIVAAFRGLVLFLRNPLSTAAAALVPFLAELLLLWGVAWIAEQCSAGEATFVNLSLLFVATQLAVAAREITRA